MKVIQTLEEVQKECREKNSWGFLVFEGSEEGPFVILVPKGADLVRTANLACSQGMKLFRTGSFKTKTSTLLDLLAEVNPSIAKSALGDICTEVISLVRA